jgi:Tol biopolymer transport system component
MRIRHLLLGLMTVSLVACDLSGDQAGATLARGAEMAGLPQTASDTLVVLRRLSVGGDRFSAYHVAPDGSFLVGNDNPTGELAVIDPRSQEVRIVNPRNVGSWDPHWTEGAVVSPDGKRIAYNWAVGDSTWWGYEFRIVNLDGSDDRLLLENENHEPLRENGFIGGFIVPWAWTADGWILGVGDEDWGEGRPETLMLISEQDGETRTLKEFPEEVGVGKSDISSDGRYVAYQARTAPETGPDIYVLSIADGRDTQVARAHGDARLLGWVPGQDAILFHADNGVWRLELSEGEAVGDPVLIRPDVWGIRPIGFSVEGLVYEVGIEEAGLYNVSLDLEAGRAVGPVTEISREGMLPAWSPDARFLASRENGGIVIRTVESGERREIPLPFRGVWNIQWKPDGGSILFIGREPPSDAALYELDLTTEVVSEVGAPTGNPPYQESLSPDGKTRYFRQVIPPDSPPPFERWIMAQNLETGITRRVQGSEPILNSRISVSPDGTMLAYRGIGDGPPGRAVKVIPAAGGEARTVFTIPSEWSIESSRPNGWRTPYAWTPDGRHVLVGAVVPGEALTIVKVPVDGGEPTTLLTYGNPDFYGESLLDLNLSPDGRTAAFVWERTRLEFWLMSGF